MLDSAAYLGKTVRFKGAIRVDEGSKAYVWVRGSSGYGSATRGLVESRRVEAGDWQVVQLSGEVHANARSVSYGVALSGNGAVHLDDVTLEIVDDVTLEIDEP